ncbi:MAG: antibiotic biosynthesis monooxygenase [Firmicutes bacterium]|nr:antibiotic biosynthesis monooxygenase [Bacillota bacterium]
MSKVLVAFEVTLTPKGKEEYLAAVEKIKPLVADLAGYERGERFQSIAEGNKLLSLHVWENEEAVAKWRNQTEHRLAQMAGREKMFSSYRITVGHVVREYTDTNRSQAPADSNQYLIR